MRRRSIPRQGGQVGAVNGRQKAGANHAPSRIQKSPHNKRFFGLSINRSVSKNNACVNGGAKPKIRDGNLNGETAGLRGDFRAVFYCSAADLRGAGPREMISSPAPAISCRFGRGCAVGGLAFRWTAKCPAGGQDESGIAPPSCMRRAQRSRIALNRSSMAALILKNICRPWRTILPAV